MNRYEDFQQQFETYRCEIEIEADGQFQYQTIEAPRMFLQHQFLSLVQQAAQSYQPVRITMRRTESVWDQYSHRQIQQEYTMEFSNNAYERMQKESA